MLETTLLERDCRTALISFDEVGTISVKTEVSCKAWSIFVNDSLHGCHLSQAIASNESRSSRTEASSSRIYICLAVVCTPRAMDRLTMHCPIALADKMSVFDVRRYVWSVETISGCEGFPAVKVTRKLSAYANISHCTSSATFATYVPRIALSLRYRT